MPDSELEAMEKLTEALTSLDPEIRMRVLRWAADRFGLAVRAPATSQPQAISASSAREDEFPDFAALYDTANPQSEAERALVAGYWVQEVRGMGDWDSQAANAELKNLGHQVSNITRALGENIDSKPRLIIQTHKSGSSRQARKKYRLTIEGIRKIRQMLSRSATQG